VGCGFVGHLLHRSGFDVSFIGRAGTIAKLRQAGHYVVRLTDGRSDRDDKVPVQDAVALDDLTGAAGLLAVADVVGVSVGTAAYGDVAPVLAAGLSQAARHVTVVTFENDELASGLLRSEVGRLAGPGIIDRHSFAGAVVDRAIAHRIFPDRPGVPVLLVAEPVDSFVIEGAALRGPIPEIGGMSVTDDFAAAYRRKLFRYSAGHAAVAYLGKIKGYRNMHAAVLDAEIAATARAAMCEGQAGLAARYGPALAGSETEVDAILARFANAALADTVARVGRDPRRKLRAEDRLIGPARLAARAGVVPQALATVAAAALCFSDGALPSLTEHLAGTGSRLAAGHVGELLAELSGLPDSGPLAAQIRREWTRLAAGQGGNLLLSLRRATWAWSPEPRAAAAPAMP
jgi:mannitol-1-phosphate 5-dehydrogenase